MLYDQTNKREYLSTSQKILQWPKGKMFNHKAIMKSFLMTLSRHKIFDQKEKKGDSFHHLTNTFTLSRINRSLERRWVYTIFSLTTTTVTNHHLYNFSWDKCDTYNDNEHNIWRVWHLTTRSKTITLTAKW